MRDRRLRSLARAVEKRYPGTEVVFETSRIPPEHGIRWLMHVLKVRQVDLVPLGRFAARLGEVLFRNRRFPVLVMPHGREVTRQFLARMREEVSRGARLFPSAPARRRPAGAAR